MPGLSGRRFAASVAGLAAVLALDPAVLGGRLAAAAVPSMASSTLLVTVRQGSEATRTSGTGSYRTLVAGPGEPYVPRLDVLGRAPDAGRAAARGRCSTWATCRTCT